VGQSTHYLKEDTMAMNPYEMRWEFLQNAQSRLESQLEHNKEKWFALKEQLETEGKQITEQFPTYPSAKEIHSVAEEMRRFVENTGSSDV